MWSYSVVLPFPCSISNVSLYTSVSLKVFVNNFLLVKWWFTSIICANMIKHGKFFMSSVLLCTSVINLSVPINYHLSLSIKLIVNPLSGYDGYICLWPPMICISWVWSSSCAIPLNIGSHGSPFQTITWVTDKIYAPDSIVPCR